MAIFYASSIGFLLVIIFADATWYNFPWSNCWDQRKVSDALDECVSRTGRDLSPRAFETSNEAGDGGISERLTYEERSAYGRRSSFPAERNFFPGLFPTRGWNRRVCRNEFLTGTNGGIYNEFNFDTIKQNIGRVAIPGKLNEIQVVVDDCRKNAYESGNTIRFFKAMRYQRCFMERLINLCRTRSPDPNPNPKTDAPTERPDARTAKPVTHSPIDTSSNAAPQPATNTPTNCSIDYSLDCF